MNDLVLFGSVWVKHFCINLLRSTLKKCKDESKIDSDY